MSVGTNAFPADETVIGDAESRCRGQELSLTQQPGKPLTQLGEFTQQFHSQCQQEGTRLPFELVDGLGSGDGGEHARSARHRLGLSSGNRQQDAKHQTQAKLKRSSESQLRKMQQRGPNITRAAMNHVVNELPNLDWVGGQKGAEGKPKELRTNLSNGFDYTRKIHESLRSSRKDVHFEDIIAQSSKSRPAKQKQLKYK